MKAVLSFTKDPLYSFFVPIAVHSWNKLGVDCIVFYPASLDGSKTLDIVRGHCSTYTDFRSFSCTPEREPTYSQVSRLFAACLDIPYYQHLIVTDADMAVFSDLLTVETNGGMTIIGYDLVDGKQFPMCYVSGQAVRWRYMMGIEPGKSYQHYLSTIIDGIEGMNIRGEQWCLDQFLLTNAINQSGFKLQLMSRAKSLEHRVATNRADRDYWHNIDYPNLIDAHLPRPGYTDENWKKIYQLFFQMRKHTGRDYDLNFLNRYRDTFLTLLK